MTAGMTLFLGTVGQSIWRSHDLGDTWERASGGLYMECDVRSLVVHPQNPDIIYAGTNMGCYRTVDGGDHWSHMPSPLDQLEIWALAIQPDAPETIYAGTRPSAIYRTTNAGEDWEKLEVNIETDCPPIIHTRVTSILFDPTDNQTIFAGIEIDGIYRSVDGGASWTSHRDGLNSLDVHGLTRLNDTARTLIATTNAGVCKSVDNGETWEDLLVNETFPWGYCRGITVAPDGRNRIFIGNGNGPPGDCGAIQWTDDIGANWHEASLSRDPNSTIWHFTVNASQTNIMFACSVSGQVFRSDDEGTSWHVLTREFGEIRALLLVNNN